MKPTEARDRILKILKSINDEKLRIKALKAALDYFKTTSIVEKKIYRARVLTFYSMWLDKVGSRDKKQRMMILRQLLFAVRK